MFDFKKRLGAKASTDRVTDPVALYETLDRASDKGPLRDAQRAVLQEWYEKRRSEQDVIIKMHTGQGKTLVGLLALQSQLNAGNGPAVYVCASHQLAAQTLEQATQFGVSAVELDREVPTEFTESRSILITIPQKLFNGETKFEMRQRSQKVGTLLLDDAHACVDLIRSQFTIQLNHEQPAYTSIRELFAADLESQGTGTYAELVRNEYDAILPVPYWAWTDKLREVTNILADSRDVKSVRFAWPMLKDHLERCSCIVSGTSLEIGPSIPPLELFGSYHGAKHRIYMSATVSEDAFLIKGLGMSPDAVRSPVTYGNERWSGEKMILIPSLIDADLNRTEVVNFFGKPTAKRNFGTVALAPSFARTKDWEALGAIVCKAETIERVVDDLRIGKRENPVVLVNRYDGVDLPDAACRILIMDSRPLGDALQDRYLERCLGDTEAIALAVARKIEQGLGRSVRGEKDFCVVLLIGDDLFRHVGTKDARRLLSPQTRKQIEVGLEVVEMARDGLESGAEKTPMNVLVSAINQCLKREEDWKEFYNERMSGLDADPPHSAMLDAFSQERMAELKFFDGDIDRAKAVLAALADRPGVSDSQKGWYLQEQARYEHGRSRAEANTLQVAAHKRNSALLKPQNGMQVRKIALVSQKRVENIRRWVASHDSGKELLANVDSILSGVSFGVGAERFESALNDLGRALGFECERPDRSWKEGPDNLWALRDNQYMFFECKSEVSLERAEITKYEADQLNTSSEWFKANYPGSDVTRVMIVPARKLAGSAAFRDATVVMRDKHLGNLRKNVKSFFGEFANVDLRNVDAGRVQALLATHNLDVEQLIADYAEVPRSGRGAH